MHSCLPVRALEVRPSSPSSFLRKFRAIVRRNFSQSARLQDGGSTASMQRFEESCCDLYPRLRIGANTLTCHGFRSKYRSLEPKEKSTDVVRVRGRIQSIRSAGPKLYFVDIRQMGSRIQALCDFQSAERGLNLLDFKKRMRSLRRGDIIEIEGTPERTPQSKNAEKGELSLRTSRLPDLLAPCLHSLPESLDDAETKMRRRHVDFHLNQKLKDTIQFRSQVIQFLRQYLTRSGHLEVQTPILAGGAGGAIARSFQTSASEFMGRKLSLRIAPELWLKRLIVGGFDRVFEVGPSFRNEGIDTTHNPEFTTCEFYRAYTNINDLIETTEDMLTSLSSHAKEMKRSHGLSIDVPDIEFQSPFKRLDFVTHLEAAAGFTLPDLRDPRAYERISQLLTDRSIPFHDSLTLPQLLDRLSSRYLESQSLEPTWIINHPECLSPLSKSFIHPKTGQAVALRGELFIGGREIVNTYEEENSPFEQRRKFLQQLQFSNKENDAFIDESYIEALEWGMPPTGGWGCGIDRLCMLMTGTSRINDVLSFGNLRNVLSLKTMVQENITKHV